MLNAPENRTAVEGSDASFSCIADSSPNKVSYQWFYEGEELHAAGTLALRSKVEVSYKFVYDCSIIVFA